MINNRYDIELLNNMMSNTKKVFCIDGTWHGDNEVLRITVEYISNNSSNVSQKQIENYMFNIIDDIVSKNMEKEYYEQDIQYAKIIIEEAKEVFCITGEWFGDGEVLEKITKHINSDSNITKEEIKSLIYSIIENIKE